MRLIDLIKNNQKFFSIEITPPFKNKSINTLFRTIERILPYHPTFINITYHPLKTTKIKIENIDKEFILKKHVDHIALCAAIKYKYEVEVVPHFVCAGLNKIEVEDTLFDFSFLGIENILVLRGDPENANEAFKPVDGGYRYAVELVTQIHAMKQALFMNKIDSHEPIDFCVGVAGYPEKHFEAVSTTEDIDNLKKKIDAGADFIITQLCYDVNKFTDWTNLCRKANINVPIIPGFKPLTTMNQIHTLKNVYNINIPSEIEKNMAMATEKNQAWEYGIQHGIDFSIQLLSAGVPGIHYFTMGNGKDIAEVVKNIF